MQKNEVMFVVEIKDKKTGEVIDIIGGKGGMTSKDSLKVLSGVRINMDSRKYSATTVLCK